ncbi:hypothetical protein B0T14DRAFT_514323 [Immersiella caudata]|uniref:Glucose-methanol-choline oxidoreductase N-terminal domain-containing protein n=1 Tax=Immersiella caudata TaxID=314043 RepID=A0AA39WW60_9PEZI|nr:hypothetical protein B0T14DRAFT_514323 [Immersiella caudata]
MTKDGGALYDITSVPSPGLANRTFRVDVGFVVGGSSAVNGMIFQRGNAKDYDIWGELAGPNNTWSWSNLVGYFRKGVQLTPPKPEVPADFNLTYDMQYWGNNYTRHNIFATYPNNLAPGIFPMHQALKAIPGVNVAEDSGNGETGIAYWMTSTDPRTGARSYAKTGHWDGLNRPNYQLLPETRVNEIIFEGNVAVGVRITPRGANTSTIVTARKEVVLAAGAIHTPQILQLSGIGPADLLQRAKIPVKVDLPGVGSNFQDHSYTDVSFRCTPPFHPIICPPMY